MQFMKIIKPFHTILEQLIKNENNVLFTTEIYHDMFNRKQQHGKGNTILLKIYKVTKWIEEKK